MLKRKINKICALVISFVLVGTSSVFAADKQYVFDKEQSIVNYGNELMDMENSRAFDIYMAMFNVTPDLEKIKVEFSDAILLEGKSTEEILASENDKVLLNKVSNDAQLAIDAFFRDNPEIFWIDLDNSTASASIMSKNGSLYITGVNIKLAKKESIGGAVDAAYDAVLDRLNEILKGSEGLSIYEKIKYFHDYICDNIYYDDSSENAYSIYGGLIEGKGVCESYSEIFKALCDKAGIPCVIVSGFSNDLIGNKEAHMWNYCLLDDDKWYAVDVTWDDVDEISYEYFLVGSSTKNSLDMSFSESHLPNGDFSFSSYYSFNYPLLSENIYNYNSDYFVLGDLNKDAVISSQDALLILKIAAKLMSAEEYHIKAADADGNGIVNSVDALNVLKYAAHLINEF